MEASIRRAVPGDAEPIAHIYNHYIRTSCATFDTEAKSAEDRAEWIAERSGEYPVLVAECEDAIVGWGALSKYAPRPAWKNTVEVGLYVHPDHQAKGFGTKLLQVLVETAREIGHHALIAQVVSSNSASILLMKRAEFEQVGYLREVGFKFEKLHDVVLLERII